MSQLINRRDLEFLLYEILDITSLCNYERYQDHDRQTFDGILDITEQMALDKFYNHAAKLDANEPHFDGDSVHIIPEVKQALDTYREAGFIAATFDAELGGMQLPRTIAQSCNALFAAANVGTSGYGLLTVAAANMLNAYGNERQKKLFLGPMLTGDFFGTMCMSEAHAGSSLADIRTRAEPQDDGSYRIYGTKMWISGGEHELSENIIHMVLAKIPGGPQGVKGISLFIVPKYLVNEDGSLAGNNDVNLTGLNHKMGWRGTVNTVLNFGEQGRCTGYLLGEKHKGMSHMFLMLNEARILVGLEAVALAYTAYLYSLDYARSRLQGHPLDSKDPTSTQVPIIKHADVRRMLLLQKVYVEGGLGLLLYGAHLLDQQIVAEDQNRRNKIGLMLDLLTPIMKTWPAEYCLEANKLAIQVLGGYGYARDYPVERLYRDNRLNAIHDGTNGIQSLDLLGRKVVMQNGAAFKLFIEEMETTLAEMGSMKLLDEFILPLQRAISTLKNTTATLTAVAVNGDQQRFLANATTYLFMFGHVIVAWIWLRQAAVAVHKQNEATGSDKDFYRGKLDACRFFFRHELPKTEIQAQLLNSLDNTCLTIPDESF